MTKRAFIINKLSFAAIQGIMYSNMVAEVTLIGMDDTVAMVANPRLFDLQKEAIKLYCSAKFKSNPNNTVGLSSMRLGNLQVFFDPCNDLNRILRCVQGTRTCGTMDFHYGVVYTKLGFMKRCSNDMRKRMLFFVGGPLNSDKPELEALGLWLKDNDIAVDVVRFHGTDPIDNAVKKERLEAFVNAVNNNNNTSHIAYLEPGCDVRQVLTESGILTCGISIKDERATQKNKAEAQAV